MPLLKNSISNWIDGDTVSASQMNQATQELYQRLSAITDFSANRYSDYRQGVIFAIKGGITTTSTATVAGVLTVGDSSLLASDNYAIGVRFPTNTTDSVLPGSGVFGYLSFGASSDSPSISNKVNVPLNYTGYAVITYTITKAISPESINLLNVSLSLSLTIPVGSVVVAVISGGLIDTTKVPNYFLITQVDNVSGLLYQQGRLSPEQTNAYLDSPSVGNRYLYFLPTEQGNLISLYNTTSNSWITQSFDSNAQIDANNLSGSYDVYVSTLTTTTVQLTPIAWTNSTTPPARTSVNGRWVQGSGATIDRTKLLVGSINVTGGVVISWSGNRSIFNLYNRVVKSLFATFGNTQWNQNTYNTVYNPTNNNNQTDGQGRFSFLLDPLSPQTTLNITYAVNVTIGNTNNVQGEFGLLCNISSAVNSITAMAFKSTGSNNSTGVLSLNCIFDRFSTTNANFGMNYILKVDRNENNIDTNTANFIENRGGLTAEFWC